MILLRRYSNFSVFFYFVCFKMKEAPISPNFQKKAGIWPFLYILSCKNTVSYSNPLVELKNLQVITSLRGYSREKNVKLALFVNFCSLSDIKMHLNLSKKHGSTKEKSPLFWSLFKVSNRTPTRCVKSLMEL